MGETFGLHLMLDGYGCDRAKLENEDFIHEFLDVFPENIGMTKLMRPYVSRYEASDQRHSGLSGFVLIAESHVSIHTFPWKGYVSIDVFSCKSFDVKAAEREIVRMFGIKSIEKNIFERGVEYPEDYALARRIVRTERDQRELRVIGLEYA